MQLHDHLTNSATFSSEKTENPALIAKALRNQGITVPFPSPTPTENTKWSFKFEKPEKITVVGSWANEMSVKYKDGINFGVDLAVEMPNVSTFSYSIWPFLDLEINNLIMLIADHVPRKGLPKRSLLP